MVKASWYVGKSRIDNSLKLFPSSKLWSISIEISFDLQNFPFKSIFRFLGQGTPEAIKKRKQILSPRVQTDREKVGFSSITTLLEMVCKTGGNFDPLTTTSS